MPSERAPLALRLAAGAVVLFLHAPFAVVLLYCFTTEDASFRFPPPGLTLRWFAVAAGRDDVWSALFLSLRVAAAATALALVLGTLAAFAVHRGRFFGREAFSLLLVLPTGLPGIIPVSALRSAMSRLYRPSSTTTIVLGHATFCVVVVYNNVVARLRRLPSSQVDAAMDLGASPFETCRDVLLPHLRTALVA